MARFGMPAFLIGVLAVLTLIVLGVPAARSDSDPAVAAATAPIPSGREGNLIRYGRTLMLQTRKYAGKYVNAGMDCAACHVDAGTKAHGGSFLGIYAMFPQWNKRSHRFIALQDRLQECFIYSMNGNAPPPDSHEIIAMTAYIAWLSRNAPVGVGFPNQGFVKLHASRPADKAAGAKIYATQCSACHGQNGGGNSVAGFPPLWGPKSFNDDAGMNTKMASFVKANMPQDKPGSLSDQQAVDVSAYVLSHPRPAFNPNRSIQFPPKPAKFF